MSSTDKCYSIPSTKIRFIARISSLFLWLTLLAASMAIPFLFESSSMLYKFGVDKALLRTGKIIGMLAALLILIQPVLSARLKFLDRIFALNSSITFHRFTGNIICFFVILHPIFILASEGMFMIPLELRYWPEFIGVFLLLLIIGMIVSSTFRKSLKIPFNRWRILHRILAFIIVLSLFIHVLFVSETFEQGLPQTLVFWAAGLCALLLFHALIKACIIRYKPFTITAVTKAGPATYLIEASPKANPPRFLPGQFGFIRILSSQISNEEHPFTIASSPTQMKTIQFIIRTSGDWTRTIKNISPGDRMLFNGPFGQFSHLLSPNSNDIIMIAGGIGITPMLAMLRYMMHVKDDRPVLLIWSNKTPRHIVCADEFKELEAHLTGLRIIHFFSRPTDGSAKRLDTRLLGKFLANQTKTAATFICGPPQMTKSIRSAMIHLGYHRRLIFTEYFNL